MGVRQTMNCSCIRCAKSVPLALVFLCLSSGCVKVTVIDQDPNFRKANLVSGKIGVAAVTGLGGGEYFLSTNISDVLIAGFRETYPEIQIIPLSQMKPLLPEGDYEAFTFELSELKGIKESDFDLLGRLASQTRFVILVDILEDDARRWEERSASTHYRRVYDKKRERWEEVYDYTAYESSRAARRSVQALIIICDLQRRQPVWAVVGSARRAADNTRNSTSSYPAPPRWPGAPSSVDLTSAIVRKALRRLPK